MESIPNLEKNISLDKINNTKFLLLNAYIINYNRINKTKGGLIESIELSNPSLTNNKIDSFYKDLKSYNSIKDKDEIYISEYKKNDNDYCLTMENIKLYSNIKISLFLEILNYENWIKKDWIIV